MAVHDELNKLKEDISGFFKKKKSLLRRFHETFYDGNGPDGSLSYKTITRIIYHDDNDHRNVWKNAAIFMKSEQKRELEELSVLLNEEEK